MLFLFPRFPALQPVVALFAAIPCNREIGCGDKVHRRTAFAAIGVGVVHSCSFRALSMASAAMYAASANSLVSIPMPLSSSFSSII